MALPAYDTIILQYQEEVTILLNECVYQGYMALSGYLKTPLRISVVLYIAVLGISIMQGWTSLSMKGLVRSALKLGLINFFAMNWGNFSAIVVNGFQGAASEISSVMLSATPVELPHFAGEGMTGALQSLLIEVAKVGNFLFTMKPLNPNGAIFVKFCRRFTARSVLLDHFHHSTRCPWEIPADT